MKKTLVIMLILTAFSGLATAQETNAETKNVEFFVVGEKIQITYDIVGASRQEVFNISLECILNGTELIIPSSIEGDVGENIKPGKGKKIYWAVLNDLDELEGDLEFRAPIVDVKRVLGGPGNALYSVLVPGLGDYYVANPVEMTIKPYYRTIAAYGLVGYGLYERFNANQKYDEYLKAVNPEDFDALYEKANGANHRSYIALGAGIAVWAYDVIWVLVKGAKNNKENKYMFQGNHDGGLYPGLNEYGVNLTYVIKF